MNQIVTTISLFASIFAICYSTILQPKIIRCPGELRVLDGVRIDDRIVSKGMFKCSYVPIGGDDDVFTGKTTSIVPPGFVVDRIHCTGGSLPIVVDTRTVGCSR